MKKTLLIAVMVIAFFKGYSQSLAFTDLTDIYSTPQNKISTFLTNTKHFGIFIDKTPPTIGLMRYIKNKDSQEEETVMWSSGTSKPDGTYIPHLGYITTDSLYLANIQKQIEDLHYTLTSKRDDDNRWEYDYSNAEFIISLVHIKGRNYYVLNLKRKDE